MINETVQTTFSTTFDGSEESAVDVLSLFRMVYPEATFRGQVVDKLDNSFVKWYPAPYLALIESSLNNLKPIRVLANKRKNYLEREAAKTPHLKTTIRTTNQDFEIGVGQVIKVTNRDGKLVVTRG